MHHGPAVALVACYQTAAWAPTPGPHGWSSSLQQAAAAVACSSQTRTGNIPLVLLPVRPRDHSEDKIQAVGLGSWGAEGMLPRQHESGPVFLEAKCGALKSSSQLAGTMWLSGQRRPSCTQPVFYLLGSSSTLTHGCVCVCVCRWGCRRVSSQKSL